MNGVKKIRSSALCFLLTVVLSCSPALASGVTVYIGCNDGSVDAFANAWSSSPFGHVELDLSIQGPDYDFFNSTSGTGSAYLTGNAGFEYDAYYTATACAFWDDDDGSYFACDTQSCVTPIQPTK